MQQKVKANDAAGRAKCVFDVSDFVVHFSCFLEAEDFQPFFLKPTRLRYSGDRQCLFPDGRLQPSTPPAFPTTRVRMAGRYRA